MRSILTDFSAQAPEAMAPVIDAGMFNETSLAYIVTKWPGDEPVARWIREYENRSRPERHDSEQAAATIITGGISALQASSRPVPSDLGAPVVSSRPPDALINSHWGEDQVSSSPAQTNQADPADLESGGVSGLFKWRENTIGAPPVQKPTEDSGTFTRRFFGDAGGGSAEAKEAAVNQPKVDPGPARKMPSPSERAIRNDAESPGMSATSMAPPRDASTSPPPKISRPIVEAAEAGQFTELFFKSIEPQPRDLSPDIEEKKRESVASGEFTSFFRGPFSGEQPGVVPKVSADFAPRQQAPGDFTRVFGAGGSSGSTSGPIAEPPIAPSGRAAQDGSSTAVFSTPSTPATKSPAAFDWEPTKPVDYSAPPAPERSAPVMRTLISEPAREPFGTPRSFDAPPATPPSADPGNATRVFSRQDAMEGVHQQAAPTGPSQWTVFQRSEKAAPGISETPASPEPQSQAAANAGAAAAAAGIVPPPVPAWQPPAAPQIPYAVPQPAVPSTPAMASPQIPYSMPQPAVPAVPTMPSPQVPPPPQPAAPEKKAVSYWPLIIGLNVLFILAVLVILYFALKH